MSIIQLVLKIGTCIGLLLVFIGVYELVVSNKEAADVHKVSKSALEMGGSADQITEQQRKDHPVASRVFDASETSIKFLDVNALGLLRAIALVKMTIGLGVCSVCSVVLVHIRRRQYRKHEPTYRL